MFVLAPPMRTRLSSVHWLPPHTVVTTCSCSSPPTVQWRTESLLVMDTYVPPALLSVHLLPFRMLLYLYVRKKVPPALACLSVRLLVRLVAGMNSSKLGTGK